MLGEASSARAPFTQTTLRRRQSSMYSMRASASETSARRRSARVLPTERRHDPATGADYPWPADTMATVKALLCED